MLGALILWLTIIFASFGYSAPRNRLVQITFFLCAFSISGAIFLIVELGDPFGGIIKVSATPLQTALDHMMKP